MQLYRSRDSQIDMGNEDASSSEDEWESMLCSSFCSKCKEIFTGDVSRFKALRWLEHHQNLSEIERAVREKCYICSLNWANATRKNGDFFKTLPHEVPGPKFTTGYQVCLERFTKHLSSSDGPWNVIRIVFACERHEDGVAAIRHFDNFLAFSSQDFLRAMRRPRNTSSSRTLDIARTWLKKCVSSKSGDHEACNRLRMDGWAPTRIIQVTGKDPDLFYLRVPQEEELEIAKYTTLSYRWGSTPFTKLTKSKIQAFRNGVAISDLPKTFRDAIKVTRSLGIDFIWIDALCIVQDSQYDWSRESLTMHNVYRNSICNLAATASQNPHEGLFRRSIENSGKLGSVEPIWSNTNDLLTAQLKYVDTVVDFDYISKEVDSSPLSHRAWIFQEFLLAPRVLHFLEGQLFWKCHAGSNCEMLPGGLLEAPTWDKIDFVKIMKNEIPASHCWESVITHYSRCSSTDPSDKLIALSGVAKYFMEETGDKYIAGMWKESLDTMLTWKVSETSTLRPRPSTYKAPTWSWASIDSAVDYWDPSNSTRQQLMTLLDVNIETVEEDPTGHIAGGTLVLRGPALKLKYIGSIPNTKESTWLTENQRYIGTVRFDIADDTTTSVPLYFLGIEVAGCNPEWHTNSRRKLPFENCYRTPFKVCGIVLKECSLSKSQYTRVGFFEIKFGLSESEVQGYSEFEAISNGLDGRMDAPTPFSLAREFGFKERDEESMIWLGSEAPQQSFEIF